MEPTNLIKVLGFLPKENVSDIYIKKYLNGYFIEINFAKSQVDYGDKIKAESKTTQNFSQPENFVVLECVNRLLEKGYNPENIVLEKTWATGHGTSGRLDILVNDGEKAFLMIECKTFGKEVDKEYKNIQKNGGQLFTYFQQDTKVDYLMLYASQLIEDKIEYKSEIIKIEDNYRNAGNVEDVFARWNKIVYPNGIFDDWVNAYEYQNKLLTKKDLIPLTEADSGVIFHGFLSILRKHSVSDKPNAFNKIFNLFLAKIYDEKKRETDELGFQWKERLDDPVEFQIRLINLHRDGLKEFLKKEIVGISDSDFEYKNAEELQKKKKDRLKIDKIFDIKEVFDDESFDENFKVLKEVVQLLEKYQIRYPRKQQHLSDFFERLLTTGLKQEVGQYFTPPPITKFIVRSLPLQEMIKQEINQEVPKLPAAIDYAVGSGHFVTEILEEYQNIIDKLDVNNSNLFPDAQDQIAVWQRKKYDWAAKYVYGIEKDYRLVKVAKVGCYFYGDGLAQIIHGDGLDNFTLSKNYRGLLKENVDDAEKAKFSIVVSNPPYSVDAFKGDLKNADAKNDFTLYNSLTDRSSEIECLFVERTKQLLKGGGIAGIILPSSILSNTGIYTKTREIILKNFEIIAIAELGSNTFMATGTNTVVLFLKRRNKKDNNGKTIEDYKAAVDDFSNTFQDKTIKGLESPINQYITHVWENISFNDYISLIKKQPNEAIKSHEIYKDYDKKIKAKSELEKLNTIVERELEKIFYYILTCQQKVVLVKSGEKDTEKRFLGYEFSNRRGSEGMHPIQRVKTIDECTRLFDDNNFENPEKASTYIYQAFKGEYKKPIHEKLEKHVFRMNLVDMMTFDRVDFEKNISLAIKKKVKIESKWEEKRLDEIATFQSGLWKGEKGKLEKIKVLRNTNFKLNNGHLSYDDIEEIDVEIKQLESRKLEHGDIILEKSGGSETQAIGRVAIFKQKDDDIYSFSNFCSRIRVISKELIHPIYLWTILNEFYKKGGTIPLQNGVRLLNIDFEGYKSIKIPLPPKDIQEKIVLEIEVLEEKERKAKEEINSLKNSTYDLTKTFDKVKEVKLEDLSLLLKRGKSSQYGNSTIQIIKSGQARGFKSFDFSEKHYVDEKFVLDERQLQKGDILINSTGVGTAGRVTLFTLEGIFVVDSHITILRPNLQKVLPDFILYSLANIGFKNIEAMAMGQSGQIELSLSIIQNIKIPLPPLSEQQKIVSEIEKIEMEIAQLEATIAEIPQQKEEILKKYL